jgi:phage FluMu protein Com
MKGQVKEIEIKCPKCGYVQKIDDKGGDINKVKIN